jgi:hypothetical protein
MSLTTEGGDDLAVAFYPRQLFASSKIGQDGIFSQTSREYASRLVEGDTASGVDGFNDPLELEGGPDCVSGQHFD